MILRLGKEIIIITIISFKNLKKFVILTQRDITAYSGTIRIRWGLNMQSMSFKGYGFVVEEWEKQIKPRTLQFNR